MKHQNWQRGDVLLGQYEVADKLGEGGMGMVYKVYHRGWQIDLAVKRPRPTTFATERGKEHFMREAETWVNLPLHPHIVSCYYVRLIDDLPLIFAEYVDGGSLADWIRSRRLYAGGHRQALERVLDIAIQFTWGLHAAHEQGLVHQDIKPANVMMTPDGLAKVTDFGLARARLMAGESASAHESGQQSILVSSRGMTPAYCSPEQAAGHALSRKTDIWSWGVSILELFVGEVTWQSGILAREVLANYKPQDAAIPPMPAQLVRLLSHCFALQLAERPATMLEVAMALQEIYEREIGQAYPRHMPQVARWQADSLNNRALSLHDLGKIESALSVWEQALQIDSLHLETMYNRGIVLWRQAAITDDELVAQLEAARARHKGHWRASYLLAQVYLEQGAQEKAGQLLQEAASQAPSEWEIQHFLKQITAENTMDLPSQIVLQGQIDSLSLSADGRWLVSSREYPQRDISLWETGTGRCVRTFDVFGAIAVSARISADGSWIACAGIDQPVLLWEASTGRRVQFFWEGSHTRQVDSVSLSADGRWLASGGPDKRVCLWDASTGHYVRVFEGHTDWVESVSLSADGRWLASGSRDQTVRLWETRTGRCACIFEGHTGEVYSVSLSADGRWLASTSFTQTRLWETSTGRCVRIFESSDGYGAGAMSMSADGCWIAAPGRLDRTVCLWETRTGRCLRTIRLLPDSSVCVSLSADGSWFATKSVDGSWFATESDDTSHVLKRANSAFRAAFSLSQIHTQADITQNEQQALTLLKQFEQAWGENRVSDALSLSHQLRTLPAWERHPESLEVLKKLSSVCSQVRFCAVCSARIIHVPSTVYSMSLSADGRWLASRSEDETMRLWETSTGRCVRTFERPAGVRLSEMNLSTDGLWLIACGQQEAKRSNVWLWETSTGRCQRLFEDNSVESFHISLSADGRWLAGCANQTVRLWEVSTGRCLRIFEGHTDGVHSVSLSADGRWLASSADQTVRLWEVSTGRCLRIFEGHTHGVNSVSLSADGHWLASGSSDKMARLWEVNTGRCLRIFEGHTHWVNSVSLSADGRWLASLSDDETIRLWETSTGHCLHIFDAPDPFISAMSMNADARWLAYGSGGIIRIWELEWELEAHEVADWDEGARPYLEIFFTQHMPYAAELPQDHEPTEHEIQLALTRQGTPTWDEADFQDLIRHLQRLGYGWLRPEGVRRQLEQMKREQQGLSSAPDKRGQEK